MEFIISAPDSGKSVFTFVRRGLGLSGGILTELKKSPSGILLNGAHVTVRALLREGDRLSLELEDREEDINENIIAAPIPVEVLYEDEDVIVLNKPPAMPTHPAMNHYTDTLANALAYYYRERSRPFVFRAVNRLDSDTGGAVLIAKNRASAYRLSLSLQRGEVEKIYIAALCGRLEPADGEIRGYIRRCGTSIITREATDNPEGAKSAHTVYSTAAYSEGVSAVVCTPVTGRTHQLRVHFSSRGCPVCGDDMYGCPPGCGIERQALHAAKISFPHPRTGERIPVTAPLPEDIRTLFDIHGIDCKCFDRSVYEN